MIVAQHGGVRAIDVGLCRMTEEDNEKEIFCFRDLVETELTWLYCYCLR
jgi:hypothetical protein